MLKKLKTTKLYYNKYLYKISTKMQGLRHLRYTKFMPHYEKLMQVNGFITLPDSPINMPLYRKYMSIIQPLMNNKDIRIRSEDNTINIFLNDVHLYNRLCKDLDFCIQFVTEPENEQVIDLLQGNKKIILCKNYPHDRYKLKVTFKKLPANVKETMLKFSQTYPKEQMLLSHCSLRYLSSPKNFYWETCYVHLTDTKLFTLISLVASGYIKKVEEYVIESSINTVSQDKCYAEMDG